MFIEYIGGGIIMIGAEKSSILNLVHNYEYEERWEKLLLSSENC